VGPADRWDRQAALQFVTLVQLGLREHHYLCDVGCGSLRAGRLLIPYLLAGRYHGIEPEEWLLNEGLREHVGRDLELLRAPWFITGSRDFPVPDFGVEFNYILAQSVLTHADPDQVRLFLAQSAKSLAPGGMVVANWVEGKDSVKEGWTYPSCVSYTHTFMRLAGEAVGLKLSSFRMSVLGLKTCWGVWQQ
jgi:hypothetical protein